MMIQDPINDIGEGHGPCDYENSKVVVTRLQLEIDLSIQVRWMDVRRRFTPFPRAGQIEKQICVSNLSSTYFTRPLVTSFTCSQLFDLQSVKLTCSELVQFLIFSQLTRIPKCMTRSLKDGSRGLGSRAKQRSSVTFTVLMKHGV